MEQRRFFEVRGEESGEWLVLDAKRHPPRVICRCLGWNAPKNAALIVAALEAHNSELYSKFPLDGSGRLNEQSAVNPTCHQARLNLRLHPSLQPESPGQGTGARRRFTLRANALSIKNPASEATAESGPVVCRFVPTWGFSLQLAANGWWAASFFAVTSEAFGSPLTARAMASLVAR